MQPPHSLEVAFHSNISIIAGSVLTMIQHLYNTFESVSASVSPQKRWWEWWDPLSKVCLEDFQDMKLNLKHLQKELDAQAHHFAVNLDIAGFSVNDFLAYFACNELIDVDCLMAMMKHKPKTVRFWSKQASLCQDQGGKRIKGKRCWWKMIEKEMKIPWSWYGVKVCEAYFASLHLQLDSIFWLKSTSFNPWQCQDSCANLFCSFCFWMFKVLLGLLRGLPNFSECLLQSLAEARDRWVVVLSLLLPLPHFGFTKNPQKTTPQTCQLCQLCQPCWRRPNSGIYARGLLYLQSMASGLSHDGTGIRVRLSTFTGRIYLKGCHHFCWQIFWGDFRWSSPGPRCPPCFTGRWKLWSTGHLWQKASWVATAKSGDDTDHGGGKNRQKKRKNPRCRNRLIQRHYMICFWCCCFFGGGRWS